MEEEEDRSPRNESSDEYEHEDSVVRNDENDKPASPSVISPIPKPSISSKGGETGAGGSGGGGGGGDVEIKKLNNLEEKGGATPARTLTPTSPVTTTTTPIVTKPRSNSDRENSKSKKRVLFEIKESSTVEDSANTSVPNLVELQSLTDIDTQQQETGVQITMENEDSEREDSTVEKSQKSVSRSKDSDKDEDASAFKMYLHSHHGDEKKEIKHHQHSNSEGKKNTPIKRLTKSKRKKNLEDPKEEQSVNHQNLWEKLKEKASRKKKEEEQPDKFEELTPEQAAHFGHAIGHKLMSNEEYKHLRESNSLDYHLVHNSLYIRQKWNMTRADHIWEGRIRWLVIALIGVIVGILVVGIRQMAEFINHQKFHATEHPLEEHHLFQAWLIFAGWNLAVMLLSVCLITFLQPEAGGAGIPEVKSYLNGLHVPKAFTFRTLGVKYFGLICTISGGFVLGPEGPIIHSGALVGGWVSQAYGFDWIIQKFGLCAKTLRKGTWLSGGFRNDRDRRDFISIGAACGVSAAFGAPLGGMLFASEEVSSFWDNHLMWQTLFACVVASFTSTFFNTGIIASSGTNHDAHWGVFDHELVSEFNVGNFKTTYSEWEVLSFLALGVIGGTVGGAFTMLSLKVLDWRKKYIKSARGFKWKSVLDVVICSLLISTISFAVPFIFSCHESPEGLETNGAAHGTYEFNQWTCEEGYYNGMASLSFTRPDLTVKHLFSRGTADVLGLAELCLWMVVEFFLMVLVSGCGVPGDFIIPMFIVGACYGRIFAIVLRTLFNLNIDPGVYALLGAASLFGGVSRMTMSLSVAMMEITNDLEYLLPIIIIAIVAKYVGGTFTDPMYDEMIRRCFWPLMEHTAPHEFLKMNTGQVMSKPAACFEIREKVGDILNILISTTHHGFPVVLTPSYTAESETAKTENSTPSSGGPRESGKFQMKQLSRAGRVYIKQASRRSGKLVGLITKKHLEVLLESKIWRADSEQFTAESFQDALSEKALAPHELKKILTPEDLQATISLAPWMNRTPFYAHYEDSAAMTYQLFLSMGLRHLPVVDYEHVVVGMLSRIDLIEAVAEVKYSKFRQKHPEPKLEISFDSSDLKGSSMLSALEEAEMASFLLAHQKVVMDKDEWVRSSKHGHHGHADGKHHRSATADLGGHHTSAIERASHYLGEKTEHLKEKWKHRKSVDGGSGAHGQGTPTHAHHALQHSESEHGVKIELGKLQHHTQSAYDMSNNNHQKH